MESYAQVLNYAIPFFLVLILIEWAIGYFKGMKVNRSFDTISSLSSGYTNAIKDVLGLSVVILSYKWMSENMALMQIESSVALYVIAFIGLDFAGYCGHRIEHSVNLFWNRHIVHHSSEEFNLACALRQSISSIFGIFFFLYIPMALLGVPAKVVAIVAPLHLFAQFWYHTRLIGKMGFLEHIIVTPSHHRVHHAINKEYLDKNFSQVFIVWDKWFGTFQEELEDVPPIYGVKRPSSTWNPILINFQHFWLLLKDALRTKSWKDKLRIWFMPTGWRPEDVQEKYPVFYVDNAYTQEKYDTSSTMPLRVWAWAQLLIHLALMLFMFNNIAVFDFTYILLYGAFLMVSIFSYSTLMDRHSLGSLTELVKVAFGLVLIYALNGWYGIDQHLAGGTYLVLGYFAVSFLVAVYYTHFSKGTVQAQDFDVRGAERVERREAIQEAVS